MNCNAVDADTNPDVGLVLYLRMDETSGNSLADESDEIHTVSTPGAATAGRFCRGRGFLETGPQGITVGLGSGRIFASEIKAPNNHVSGSGIK